MDRYTVISAFVDLSDSKHVYREGDDYTYDGHAVPAKRLEELSTSNNKLGKPLIAKLERSPAPRNRKRGARYDYGQPDSEAESESETEGGEGYEGHD